MEDIRNNNKKKTTISIIIGVVSLVVVIVGATYAYWNAKGVVNFNTATITYETASKTLLTLNGTTGLLTLGTITSNDMSVYDTEKIYYASATGKKTTPTEETIGEVRTPVGDLNTYRCNFTLALTHSGSADLIDRFLSETNGEPDYENRSEGQIILTVNGVEYDLNDGFPSTINGTFEASDENPGQIKVGMKFINLPNVNQIYLKNTNGAINITVTDFSCEQKEWEIVYKAPGFYIGEGSKFDSSHTAVSDYHEMSYTYLYDNSQIVKSFDYPSAFNTLSECEYALNNPIFRVQDNYDDFICDLVDGYYEITTESHDAFLGGLVAYFEGFQDYGTSNAFFYPPEACEDAIDIIMNDSHFYYYISEHQPNGTTSSSRQDFSSNLSCVTYYPDIFVKETVMPVAANEDVWAIQYYYKPWNGNGASYYQSESECLRHYNSSSLNTTTHYYGYNGNPCVRTSDGRYLQKNLILNDDIKFSGFVRENDDVFDIKKFTNESDCISFVSDYVDENDYISPTCVQVREMGKAYQVTKSDICMYEDSNNNLLKCFPVEDDLFLYDIDSRVEELEDIGFTCTLSHGNSYHECENDRYTILYTESTSQGYGYLNTFSISGFVNPYDGYRQQIGLNANYDYEARIYIS